MEGFRHLALAYCLLFFKLALTVRGDVVSGSSVHRQTGDDGDYVGATSSPGDNVHRDGVHPEVKDSEDGIFSDNTVGVESSASNVSSDFAPVVNTSEFTASKTSSEVISEERPLGNTTLSSRQTLVVGANKFSAHPEPVNEDSHYVDYDASQDLMFGFGDSSDDDDVVKRRRKPKSKKRQPKYSREEPDRNLMLHEAVRNLLGFSDQLDLHKDHALPDTTKDKRLPEYVKDLYRRFQSGEMNAGLVHGNTIRSIHTKLGTVEGEPMFLFNLSSLKPTEKLVSAEIHIYRRRLKPWLRHLELDIVLHQVAPHYISQVGKITLRESASGWQWYDVTSAIRSCMASGKQPSHLFSLSFRKQRPNGISKPVLLRKFGKHHSMPFLVIYSNETEAVNFSQLDLLAERLVLKKEDDATEDAGNNEFEDSLLDINILNELATNDVLSYQLAGKSKEINHHISTSKKSESLRQQAARTHRKKRSILTNEIPEDPEDMDTVKQRNKVPKTHPGILQSRQDYRQQTSKTGIIPLPKNYLLEKKRKARLRKKQKQKLEQQRQRFPKEWEDVQMPQTELAKTCDRKMLRVDFADIGWADWIISPKSFEAHYCAGECPFPLTKKLRPSNHATIQSIVHAIGLYDKVPAPCCVPDVMSSITLLYFDEDRNVVLKNYPGMTVESCACR